MGTTQNSGFLTDKYIAISIKRSTILLVQSKRKMCLFKMKSLLLQKSQYITGR